MNHELKYNKFHYFEKQQLEDYINEMAKNGKYLTKIHSQYLVFKTEPVHEIYYYVDVYSKKDGFINIPQKEEYFEYFQKNGYQLLDYCEPFSIFTSTQARPIHTDEKVEKDVISKTSHRHFIYDFFMSACGLFLFWAYFSLDVLSISNDYWIMSILFWLFIFLNVFIANIYPFVKYKLTKKVNYTYIHILKRSYYTSILIACLFSLIAVILAKMPYITYEIIIIIYIIVGVVGSCFINKTENIWFALKIPLTLFCLAGLISISYFISGTAYPKVNLPIAAEKPYIIFQQSSLACYVNYEVADSNQLMYFESYSEGLYPIVLKNLLSYSHYTKTTDRGYDLYFISEDNVLVCRDNRILRGNHQLLNTETKKYLEFGW